MILALEPQFSIDLQRIGGVLILQTLPPIVFGLLTRWFHPWALLCGWAAGLVGGLLMLYNTANPLTGKEHFGGAQYALSQLGFDTKATVYTGILALLANIAVTLVVSLVLRRSGAPDGADETRAHDYHVEAGDPEARPLPQRRRSRRHRPRAETGTNCESTLCADSCSSPARGCRIRTSPVLWCSSASTARTVRSGSCSTAPAS